MIDTDKYESITPERWTVDEDDLYRVVDAQECTIARTDFIDIEEERTWQLANARLIADAPLLLAEVKRLRGVIARVWDLMQNSNHQDREAYFWGFDGKNTGWMKVHEELAMRELNWGEEE